MGDEEENDEAKFKCGVCNKRYSSAQSLSRHKKIHSSITKKCTVCMVDVPSAREDNYKRHVERCRKKNEKEEPKHYCDSCDKSFTKKQHLERHLESRPVKKRGCRISLPLLDLKSWPRNEKYQY